MLQYLDLNCLEITVVDKRAGCGFVASTAEFFGDLVGRGITATSETHLVTAIDLAHHDDRENSPIDLEGQIDQVLGIRGLRTCFLVIVRKDKRVS